MPSNEIVWDEEPTKAPTAAAAGTEQIQWDDEPPKTLGGPGGLASQRLAKLQRPTPEMGFLPSVAEGFKQGVSGIGQTLHKAGEAMGLRPVQETLSKADPGIREGLYQVARGLGVEPDPARFAAGTGAEGAAAVAGGLPTPENVALLAGLPAAPARIGAAILAKLSTQGVFDAGRGVEEAIVNWDEMSPEEKQRTLGGIAAGAGMAVAPVAHAALKKPVGLPRVTEPESLRPVDTFHTEHPPAPAKPSTASRFDRSKALVESLDRPDPVQAKVDQLMSEPVPYAEHAKPAGKGTEFPANEGRFAYRVRDAGEQGVPQKGQHAHATTSVTEAQRLSESRGGTGLLEEARPQEIAEIPLAPLAHKDYTAHLGPNGQSEWIQFHRALTEKEVRPIRSALELKHLTDEEISHALSRRPPDRAGDPAAPSNVAEGVGRGEGQGPGLPEPGGPRFTGLGETPREATEQVRPALKARPSELGEPDRLTHATIGDLRERAGMEEIPGSRFKRSWAETHEAAAANYDPLVKRALAAKPGEILSDEVRAAGSKHYKELVEAGRPEDWDTADKLSKVLYETSSGLGRGLAFGKSMIDQINVTDAASVIDTGMRATKGKLSVQAKMDLADMSKRARATKEKIELTLDQKAEAALKRLEGQDVEAVTVRDLLKCR